ncbi:kinesin-like protein KIN-14J isoform X2 [Beta vulgaris subsp. vulgaris]|uniref:kinesin-like protein KIN-14J isoform X2 n=1 Tax=Beta vulgaris subsp. vulgaris TaxID=3555 RepID=UPI00203755DC|nr:kinesin-like protein KIN-14J isoform X2 [Beta vulgaris subsp. vulgaris]
MDMQAQVHLGENGVINVDEEAYNGDDGQTESFQTLVKDMIDWLNEQLPDMDVPADSSLEDLRVCLQDGTALCNLLNALSPGAVNMDGSSEPQQAIEFFLSTLDKMSLSRFDVSDLEQGSMVKVLKCLQGIKSNLSCNTDRETAHNHVRRRWNVPEVEGLDGTDCSQVDSHNSAKFGPEKRRNSWESKFQTVFRSTTLSGNLGPDVKISELVKWNSLDKAPMQLLFSMVDRVLDESLERRSGDVPHRVACLLKKLVREIERRVSNQADKIKNQNNLCKVREGKYQSKVRALETLVVGAAGESEVAVNHLRQIKTEKIKLEEKSKHGEEDVVRLMKERDEREIEIGALKHELELVKMSYEKDCSQLEIEVKETRAKLQEKIMDLESLLQVSNKKVNELEETFEHEIQKLKNRELRYSCFLHSQFDVMKVLRMDLDSVKRELLKTQNCYPLEFQFLGTKLKELVDAAENYHMVLAENRKLYNKVQDLKGNIRVYCRIRPFLPGQNEKQTTIEYIGENGELVVFNPLKPGKDSRRLFKFNKVFAPTASQEEVFIDTQPLIRSVLDGYDVCIFAYGQTGSGKTYTMTGPDMASKEDWGVNYRALHDLFQISQNRRSSIMYEIGVQMVEIYNEQVRDLLTCDGSQKRLGIWSTTQPNGLAVPDASMHPVRSTNDVLELMNVGFMNRAVGATALNERSSRSHSILTVHVRGTELKSNSVLRGCLHLVDLAGSERVDRSEATGDRLREAQHINRSLSALGDVIFALAQKNPHVPYRNSKLTQVLQSSLGGQAKTLMFVQLNPDVESYSETASTLKFAERVSGVELGAARSSKEGKDVRELMEQVAALKATIAKKDEDIERFRLGKANANSEKRGVNSLKLGVPSPGRRSSKATRPLRSRPTSDQDYCSEQSDRHSEAGSQHSVEELKHQHEILRHPDLSASDAVHNFNDDIDLLGFGDVDSEERLSDISDSGLSMGTETDGSICSVVEYTLFPEVEKPVQNLEKSTIPNKLPKPPQKQQTGSSRSSLGKTSSKVVSSSKKQASSNSSSANPKVRPSKRWA